MLDFYMVHNRGEMEPGNVPKKKKIRRNSLKAPAGLAAFKLVTTCVGYGSLLETNEDIADILIQLTKPRELAVLYKNFEKELAEEFEMFLDFGSEQWDCVGILISIDYLDGRHAKPFIKIGTDWFDGDNMLGYLRKLQGPPTKNMSIKISNTVIPYAEISKAVLFYKERRFVTERSGNDWAGKPTFAQLGSSCGPDGLMSILMFADGFYETFNAGYYQALKPFIDERFTYDSVKAKPYTEEDLEEERNKLIQILPIKRNGAVNLINGEPNYNSNGGKKLSVSDALNFLIYSFIRFYTIESMAVRNYEVLNNKAGGKRKTRRRRRI
jgi:hypothetical protein